MLTAKAFQSYTKTQPWSPRLFKKFWDQFVQYKNWWLFSCKLFRCEILHYILFIKHSQAYLGWLKYDGDGRLILSAKWENAKILDPNSRLRVQLVSKIHANRKDAVCVIEFFWRFRPSSNKAARKFIAPNEDNCHREIKVLHRRANTDCGRDVAR
jgi:hypothetical protein